MKLLIINTIEFNRNGMSTMIMNYYKHFDHADIKVDFLINKSIDTVFENEILKNKDQVFIFKNRNRSPLQYIKYLRNLAKVYQYDVVYIHGNSATMAAEEFALRKLNTKVVVHAHGETTEHQVIHKLLLPYFYKHYDYALAASIGAGKFLYGEKNFDVIKNGINANDFSYTETGRENFRKKNKINENDLVILQVGAFTEQKNHIFTLKLFKKMIGLDNNYKLVLAGDGPLKEHIIKQIKQLGLVSNVCLLGEISNLQEVYSGSDYLIFPSSWEPFGIVALEGQMAGLPVFLSNKFSKKVAVTNNCIFLPLNVDIWLERLGSSPKRDRLNDNDNYALAKQLKNSGYDIHDNVDELVNLLRTIVGEKHE